MGRIFYFRNDFADHLPERKSSILELQVFFLFFISGFTGPLYQIVWLQKIQLLNGHTLFSTSLVLGIFLSGLALGCLLANFLRPLKNYHFSFYLLLELFIGLYALSFNSIYSLANYFYNFGAGQTLIGQSLIATALLIFPTLCMGATLPLLASSLYGDYPKEYAQKTPWLYGINALGAAFGSWMVGHILLPWIGQTSVLTLGAFLNVSVLFLAMFFNLKAHWPNSQEWKNLLKIKNPAENNLSNKELHLLSMVFLSGFLSLGIQLVWNRVTSLSYGPSHSVFPLVTTIVLLGIFLGSFFIKFLPQKEERLEHSLLITIILSVVSIYLGHTFYFKTPLVVLSWHQSHEMSATHFGLYQYLWAMLCLLPAATFLGAIFPLSLNIFLYKRGPEGHGLHLAYGLNIFGLLISTFIFPFFLIPWFGLENITLVFGFLLIVSALPLVPDRFSCLALLILAAITVRLAPKPNKDLLVSGYFYNRTPQLVTDKLSGLGHLTLSHYQNYNRSQLLEFVNDSLGTVSVHKTWDDFAYWFKVDGKVDGSNMEDDQKTFKLPAILPLLVKSDYQKVLTIGLGTGLTTALTQYYPKLEESTVVELSSAIIKMAKKYFFDLNDVIWNSSKFKVIQDDGRNFIRHSKKKFDLIISEPSNPWVDGVASLYTIEFFKEVFEKLTPGGVFSLWFHSYGLECSSIESVFLSLGKVFPHVKIFKNTHNFYILASPTNTLPLKKIEIPHLESTFFHIMDANKIFQKSPKQAYTKTLEGLFHTDGERIRKMEKGGILNTDDNRYLQSNAGRSYWSNIGCPFDKFKMAIPFSDF